MKIKLYTVNIFLSASWEVLFVFSNANNVNYKESLDFIVKSMYNNTYIWRQMKSYSEINIFCQPTKESYVELWYLYRCLLTIQQYLICQPTKESYLELWYLYRCFVNNITIFDMILDWCLNRSVWIQELFYGLWTWH